MVNTQKFQFGSIMLLFILYDSQVGYSLSNLLTVNEPTAAFKLSNLGVKMA